MTTPIERASEPARNAYRRTAATDDRHVVWPAVARAVFDSIDTDELAEAIHGDQCPEDPDPGDYCTCDGAHYDRLALVVKNWLTGKDQ